MIVMPQLSGGCGHDYSAKTRLAGSINEQSIYSLMSMKIMGITSSLKFTLAIFFHKVDA
jgi:hypothetical protein